MMRIFKKRKISSCILALTIIYSCTPVVRYQDAWPNVKISSNSNESTNTLAVVEFDEQGDLWAPTTSWKSNQLEKSLTMIKSIKKPLLITYVHGWRHNAKPDDNDLVNFKKFIDKLNKNKPAGYTACGIYVGWRGAAIAENHSASIITTPAALLSFWNRKAATDRVADIGLCRLLNMASYQAWKNDGLSVTIGHSFGGRILERVSGMAAVSQSGNLGKMKPISDLTILVNPASESLTARKIKLALKGWKENYPLIVAVGAKDDDANGKAWKWGYKLSNQSPTRNYIVHGRADSQKKYLSQTVTNDHKQITHDLIEDKSLKQSSNSTFSGNLSNLSSGSNSPIWIHTDDEDPPKAFFLTEIDTHNVPEVNFVLESKAYWTLQVPEIVLSGHSGDRSKGGIFSRSMTDLIAGIMARAELSRRSKGGPSVSPVAAATP